MMRQAPLRENRAATADDAGSPIGSPRDVAQQNSGMNREVIDTLLGLFDQSVTIKLPRQFFRTADLFQRLIDRHSADRHRRIPQNPFPYFVNVATGGKIHDGVASPRDA